MSPDKSERAAAQHILKSAKTLQRMRALGAAPAHYRIGRTVYYRTADLDAWIEQQRIRPIGNAATILGGLA